MKRIKNISSIKALLWLPRYWPAIGGSELHSRRLAHELAKKNKVAVLTHCNHSHTSTVIAAANSVKSKNSDGATTIFQTGSIDKNSLLLKTLARLHSRVRICRPLYSYTFRHYFRSQVETISEEYDLIHAIYNGLTESAELAAATARRQNKPFVWTPLCCTDNNSANAWSSPRFRHLYRQADALIAMTQHEKQWLVSQGAKEDKIHVIPYAPLLTDSSGSDAFRQRYQLGDNRLVLFLSRATEAKGFDLLIKSAELVWQDHPDTHFLFIGPDSNKASRCFNIAHDPRLIFIDSISQSDKCAAIEAADIFAMPSRSESLGVVYLEAWHYKKPVVALDLPVLREVIEHESDGLLCMHNVSSVAAAIIHLLKHPDLSKKMGQQGAIKLSQHYNWADIAGRLRAVYQQLLSQPVCSDKAATVLQSL